MVTHPNHTIDADWAKFDSAWTASGLEGPTVLSTSRDCFDARRPCSSISPKTRVAALGGTLLPGLWDHHVHTSLIQTSRLLSGGISACRDLGGAPERLAELRRSGQDRASSLPLTEVCGAFLTAPGGYPTDRRWAEPGSCRTVLGVDDAQSAVAEQLEVGPSRIKVCLHTGGPRLSTDVVKSIVSRAHRAGVRVVAHAEGVGMCAEALECGIDELAHTPWTEILDPAMANSCATQMVWTTTLSIHRHHPAQLNAALHNLTLFLEAGGQIRYGTDLGNGELPVGVNKEEIRLLHRVGLSTHEVLAAMTEPLDLTSRARPCWVPGGLTNDPAECLPGSVVLFDSPNAPPVQWH